MSSDDPILNLPVSGISISIFTFGEDNELRISVHGAIVHTWPQHCTLMESLSKGTWPCLRVLSTDRTVSFMVVIADPAEQTQMQQLLARLQE